MEEISVFILQAEHNLHTSRLRSVVVMINLLRPVGSETYLYDKDRRGLLPPPDILITITVMQKNIANIEMCVHVRS